MVQAGSARAINHMGKKNEDPQLIVRTEKMRLVRHLLYLYCVILENIQTSPTEGIFSKTPHPLWKFQLSFIHFFKCFGLAEPPTPWKSQSLLWGEYGYFLELHIVCLTVQERFPFMRNGFKFLNQVESKTSQFEIVFKSLARFNTQFRMKESFKLLFAS